MKLLKFVSKLNLKKDEIIKQLQNTADYIYSHTSFFSREKIRTHR